MSFPLGDGTVGVKQAELPDRFIANKKKTNQDDEVVYVQETYDEEVYAALSDIKTALAGTLGTSDSVAQTKLDAVIAALAGALTVTASDAGSHDRLEDILATLVSTLNVSDITAQGLLSDIRTAVNRIPAAPAQEHTTAISPSSTRLSDGDDFYRATTPADTQPVSAVALPLPAGAATEATLNRHARGIVREITKTLRPDASTMYIGHAPSGSDTDDSVWTIEKLVFVDSIFDHSLWSAEGVKWDDVETTPYA
jgi:hypothetical protein